MATIQKRGESYRIRVSNGRDVNYKQIIHSTTWTPDPNKTAKQNEKSLQLFVIQFEQQVKNGKFCDNKIKLVDFVELWRNFHTKGEQEDLFADNTMASYEIRLSKNIIPDLGHYNISDINKRIVSDFLSKYASGGRSDGKSGGYARKTIKKMREVLSSLFDLAIEWGYAIENPCLSLSRSRKKRNSIEKEIECFNKEQSKAFLEGLHKEYKIFTKEYNHRDSNGVVHHNSGHVQGSVCLSLKFRALFTLAIKSGLRRGELLALTWNDIEFTQNRIRVTKSLSNAKGEIILKLPKTNSSYRTVPVPQTVIALLKELKKEQKQNIMDYGSKWAAEQDTLKMNSNYVFTQEFGLPMHINTPQKKLKKYLETYNKNNSNNVLQIITLHGLRHTYATLMIASGVDLQTVSSLLGHANVSTTMDIYSHFLPEQANSAVDIMENFLNN